MSPSSLLSFLLVITLVITVNTTSDHPLVLVISFDGFRYDYLKRVNDTPNFKYLTEFGVQAEWVKPVFPSLTFPNHHSIVTGLYSETHGITGNTFYDPILNDVFTMSSTDRKWWDVAGVIPLYIQNELEGQGRHSGTMMWPCGVCSSQDHNITYVQMLNETIPYEIRVDIVMNWFTNEQKPANMVFMYFEEPDLSGHEHGPDSDQVVEQVRRADNITGYLMEKLRAANLFDRVNLIITSDHGMASVPVENDIDLTNVLNQTYFDVYSGTPLVQIQPKPGFNDVVYEAFRNASFGNHFTAYRRDEIPEEFHYRNNLRISPIVLLADLNYQINISHQNHTLGMHGYNNSEAEMRPFFMAHGPEFKKNYVTMPFESVDIYPLLCHLLDITLAPNNGSLNDVQDLLRRPAEDESSSSGVLTTFIVIIGVAIVGAIIFIIWRYVYRRRLSEDKRPIVYFGTLS